ncbi:hypothetical protein [Comamonas sp. JC664]|uniref:hypothetical protein n=1 Tax=Comamonas sp. JC664 TaxID=2801917 RepID=UPI00360FF022
MQTRQQLLAQCQQQASTEAVQMQRFAELLVQLQSGQQALPEGLQLARHAITQIQPLAYGRMLEMLAGPAPWPSACPTSASAACW